MYAKCGSMAEAQAVFDSMLERNVVVWNSLIHGYVENGESELALQLFHAMKTGCDPVPNARTYVAALAACASLAGTKQEGESEFPSKWLDIGKVIHSQAVSARCCDVFVQVMLINMYGRFGRPVEAREVFETASERNVACWNALLQSYAENEESWTALELFDCMDCVPDARSYVAAITACAGLASRDQNSHSSSGQWLRKGRELHHRALVSCSCDMFVENSLINMYGKCRCMVKASAVFDGMVCRDTISYNALIQGYVENGNSELALETLFNGSFVPDSRTYVNAVIACAALAPSKDGVWLAKGKAIHALAARNNCCDTFLKNSLISMYSAFNDMTEAQRVFDEMKKTRNVVSWNALLQGYVENEESEVALRVFFDMDCAPNARSFVAAVAACTSMCRGKQTEFWLQIARRVHSKSLSNGCCNLYVENALISMYAKFHRMVQARCVFDGMANQDSVSWSSLAHGYVDNNENEAALELVHDMGRLTPAAFQAALMACGNSLALERGKALHERMRGTSMEKDVSVATCLVEFYGRCGDMPSAREVFDSIARKDVCAWNALAGGYSQSGDHANVFKTYEAMKAHDDGVAPNAVTYTHVLAACSHAGLVDKGKEVFDEMKAMKHGMSPDIIHYTCLVDMLARANRVEQALSLIKEMEPEPDSVVWTSLLGGCTSRSNVGVGRAAYESLSKIDHKHPVHYILMANLCKI